MFHLIQNKSDLSIDLTGDLNIGNDGDLVSVTDVDYVRQEILRGINRFDTSLIVGLVDEKDAIDIFREYLKAYMENRGLVDVTKLKITGKRDKARWSHLKINVDLIVSLESEIVPILQDLMVSLDAGVNILSYPPERDNLSRNNNNMKLVLDSFEIPEGATYDKAAKTNPSESGFSPYYERIITGLYDNVNKALLIPLATEPNVIMIDYVNYEEHMKGRAGPTVGTYAASPDTGMQVLEMMDEDDPMQAITDSGWYIDDNGKVFEVTSEGMEKQLTYPYDTNRLYPELMNTIVIAQPGKTNQNVYAFEFTPRLATQYAIRDFVNVSESALLIAINIKLVGEDLPDNLGSMITLNPSTKTINIPVEVVKNKAKVFVSFTAIEAVSVTDRALRIPYNEGSIINPLRKNQNIYKAIVYNVLPPGEYVMMYYGYNF